MRDQILRSRSFGRRALVLTGAKLFLMSTLAIRLYYLQINQSKKYKTLSDDNRIRLEPILPKRGKLFDRYGEILAENEKHYKVWFDPTQTKEPMEVLQKLVALLGVGEEKFKYLTEKLKEKPKEKILIGEHVDWKNVSAIEVNNTDLPGVSVSSVQVRNYKLRDAAVHLIGYVSAPSEDELRKIPLLNHEDFKVGRNGIERMLEEELRGRAGIRNMEVNAYGLGVRELDIEDSTAGQDISLSIDAELQKFTSEQISDKGGVGKSGGSVIVMDVQTGEIVTLVSTPGFNPNKFVEGISHEEWQQLKDNQDNPLINKAISTQYAPGSTFKIIVALAGLAKGVIGPNTRHYCPGYMDYGDRRFHCWNDRGHGQVNLKDAIAQSCNVFFYKISQDIGIDAISEMSMRFGLGSETGIQLPGEVEGLVPTKDWKRREHGKDWYVGETINSSIGQGYLLTTPVQLVKMTAQIANGGYIVNPTLLKQNILSDKKPDLNIEQEVEEKESLKVSDYHLRVVKSGMEMVVNKPMGTAYQSRIQNPEFAMAGKTGTVQVRHRVEDEDEFIPKKYRNHALFVGYAPYTKPKYAISVVIEHGGSGSFAAAPVAKLIMEKALELEKSKKGKKTDVK